MRCIMDGNTIKEKILFNNQKIEEIFDPSIFILQEQVVKLMKENEELQAQCPHEFKDGVCIYCGLEEK